MQREFWPAHLKLRVPGIAIRRELARQVIQEAARLLSRNGAGQDKQAQQRVERCLGD